MICPECGSEYRDGFTRCSDCDVPLVAAMPDPRYVDTPDSTDQRPATLSGDLELALLFETADPSMGALVQSTLDEAEIPYLGGDDALHRLIMATPASQLRPVQIWVTRDDEPEARALLDAIGGPMTEEDSAD